MRIPLSWPDRLLLILVAAWSLSTEAAVIKNVQTNTSTIPPSGVANIPITSVNTLRTFVVCQNDTAGIGSNPTTRALCELTSATNLRITINDGSGTEVVRWYVVEFYSGVTVQRSPPGGTAFAPLIPTVPVGIAAVNQAKTFVLISESMNSTAQDIDEQWTVRAELTSNANLQLTRNATGTAIAVAWQVIQIESAVVQSNTAIILENDTFVTAALNPPVDPSRTFLVFSRSGGAAVAGEEQRYQTTGVITDATTLTFTRQFADGNPDTQVDIVWFAVRMTDGTTVQRNLCGPSGTGAGSETMNAVPAGCLDLAPAIVTNRSVAFISTQVDPIGTGGPPTADLDDTSWQAALAPGAITLTRSANASNSTDADVAWQVVQFTDKPNRVDGDGREIFP
jgi:hypothetical protein